jgi:potassium/chloride transporter 9
VVATGICLAGSSLFARAGNLLFVIIVIATYSIPLSAIFVKPFENEKAGVKYTGFNYDTFKSNLYPNFTAGADGSNIKGKENWQDLFGVLFPATAGIFAGASMSGDLKKPGKSIPRGTIGGMILTFFSYILLILCMGSTISRDSFYKDSNIVQDVCELYPQENIANVV